MTDNYNNETFGIFDIKKESKIVAELIVDALIDAKIIEYKDADRASEIAMEEILIRRSMENLDK